MRLLGLLCLCGLFFSVCLCLCVYAVLHVWLWMCVHLKYAAAKSDRTEAHINLPSERLTHTLSHKPGVFSLTHPVFPAPHLQTLSISKSVSTHTFTSPHAYLTLPKGRGGWWINNGTPPIVSPAWALISTAVPAPHSTASCLSACRMCAHKKTRARTYCVCVLTCERRRRLLFTEYLSVALSPHTPLS